MDNYRKKPVVIQAHRLAADDFDSDHPNDNHIPGVIYDPTNREAIIKTLEGDMVGRIGDWIIRGVKGELYPCKDDIFAATYDSAPGKEVEG